MAFLLCPFFSYLPPAIFSSVKLIFGLDFLFAGFDSAVSFVPDTLDKDCLHFSSGDVVFTLTGENKVDIAKTVAFLGDGQIAAGGDLAFWTHHGMNPLYLVYYMASPYCIELKRRTATGDIIVHISTSKVGDFLVPVPPIKEQNRIVSAIEQLFAVASTL